MTRPLETLTNSREARAYVNVRRVIDYGRHSRTYSAADVVRVTLRYFANNAHLRAVEAERARADRAEQRVHELAEQLRAYQAGQPVLRIVDDTLPPRSVVEVGRREFDIFADWAEGKSRHEIAKEFHLKPSTVSNAVANVAAAIGADAARAAALVNRGVVRLVPKQQRRAA